MKRLITFFVCLLVMPTLQAQDKEQKALIKKLDAYYEKITNDWGIPSMSIGIVKDGEMIFAKGYGVKEVGKSEKPDENTLYAIASNSKAFTGAIIAQLVQEGKLSWTDKVKDYLPYFELYDTYVSQAVTVEDLLCHRVGLGTFSGDVIWYKADLTAEEIIKRMKHLPPAYEFRDGYGYSNLMYITAGELIRTVTGKTWGENVKERFFEPLGMSSAVTSLKALDKIGNYATPHAFQDGKNIPIPWVDWETVAAMGGIVASVNDVCKWMIFNLNHGVHGKDTLLTPASLNRLWTPHNTFTVDQTKPNDFKRHFNGYGLGWALSDYHGRMRVGHTGGYDGMITAVNLIPDENLGVVVLTNGMKSPIMAATYYTLDAFLGVSGKDWSTDMLEARNKRSAEDTRISDREKARIMDTKPSLPLESYVGTYHAANYGNIDVSLENGELQLSFEHTKEYAATLKHWHYDVWKIEWKYPQAWYNFGTVKFNTDNNLKIKRLTFDVPNYDIFFEELHPMRVDK
ncbi:MAG: serine hydrolase [Flammeovirgaceae bacterium]